MPPGSPARSGRRLRTPDELRHWFSTRHRCPDCGEAEFLEGPTGGISQNIKCANDACGSEFNMAAVGGQLLFAERIRQDGPDEAGDRQTGMA